MVDQLRPASPVVKPRRSILLFTALLVLMVGVAALGSIATLRKLDDAIAEENRIRLDAAKGVFDLLRTRALEDMRRQGRILVEDTRLKAPLATEGIDEATIADILCDVLRSLNNMSPDAPPKGCSNIEKIRGMLVVLTPEGKVFAEAGAPELRGLDLSASSVVRKAQQSNEAVVGSWVIGNKIIDLSITSIQFGTNVVAYVVVGQTIDQSLLKPLGTATGAGAGIAIGTEWTVVSDDKLRAMSLLAQNATAKNHLFEMDGTRYVASVVDLEQMGQSRPRLVLVQSLAATGATFSLFRWLLWLSPLLVLIGMVVLAVSRSNYRAS